MPPSNVPDTLMVEPTFTVLFAVGKVGIVIAPSAIWVSSTASPQEVTASAQAAAVTRKDAGTRERFMKPWLPRSRCTAHRRANDGAGGVFVKAGAPPDIY